MARHLFYLLDKSGQPVATDDVLAWATWLETSDAERQLANDFVHGARISTVFLALNQRHTSDGTPVLWETLVFGGPLGGAMRRYDTREAALAGHAEQVRICGAAHDSVNMMGRRA